MTGRPTLSPADIVLAAKLPRDRLPWNGPNGFNARVVNGDAFKFQIGERRWHLGWHDIYCNGNVGLQRLHIKLLMRYRKRCDIQGAWALPRFISRIWARKTGQRLVGSPTYRKDRNLT